MAPITHDQIGTDQDRARRVLMRARIIAPCIVTLEDSEAVANALAILRGAYAELPDEGERRLRRMSRNGTGVDLDAAGPMFTTEDEASLRALCTVAVIAEPPSIPLGSFPSDTLFERLWPEERYS